MRKTGPGLANNRPLWTWKRGTKTMDQSQGMAGLTPEAGTA